MITSIELQAEGNGSVLATLSLQIEPTPPHQVPTKFNEFLKKVTDQFMKKTALPNTIGKELLIGETKMSTDTYKRSFTDAAPQAVVCKAKHIATLSPDTNKDLWLKYNKAAEEKGNLVNFQQLQQQWDNYKDAITPREIFHPTENYFQMLVYDLVSTTYKAVSVFRFLSAPERYLLDKPEDTAGQGAGDGGNGDPEEVMPPRKKGKVGSCASGATPHTPLLQRLSDLYSRIMVLEAAPSDTKISNLLNCAYIPMRYITP